jgi:hypothetical protein
VASGRTRQKVKMVSFFFLLGKLIFTELKKTCRGVPTFATPRGSVFYMLNGKGLLDYMGRSHQQLNIKM